MMKPNKSRKMGYGKLPTKLQNVDFFFFLMIDQFFQQCVVRANKTLWNYMSPRNSKKFKTGLDSNSSPSLE